MKLGSSLFLILFLNMNLITLASTEDNKVTEANSKSNKNSLASDLQKDLEEIATIKKRSKIVACMSIVRNSLAEGNYDLKEVIDNSPFDRSKTYDKVIVSMVSNCERNIKDSEMEQALTPENILAPVHTDSNLFKLIRFDKNFFKSETLTFTDEELQILKEINESSQAFDTDVTLQDEEIGFMGLKLSQMGKTLYFFILVAFVLFFVIVIGGLYILKCKKKEQKKKKNK